MMKVALLLLLSIVLVSAYTETEYQDAFSAWMHKYQRVYTSDEFQTRYTIFKSNMDYVQEWNSKNTETVLGMNHLADLSNAEYQRIYLGTKIDGTAKLAAAAEAVAAIKANFVQDNYNATIDWRTKNAVTPIKNQGQCGSCWSFSTTGSTEGIHALSTGNLVSLSEQNLMDCSGKYGNQGCNGGLMDQAFQYIIANGGIDTEASYPYQGVQNPTCKYNAANSGATLASYKDVTSGSEEDLATFANSQPVSVAIDASHTSFQLYTSGIYYDIFCSSSRLDHGVLVVGYGVDTTSSKHYWIVKNSWGTSWGQAGFIYMSKDRNNNCGIATSASVPLTSSLEAGATSTTTKHSTTHVATASHHTASGPSSNGPSSNGPSSNGPSSSNTQSSYGGGMPSYAQGGRGAVNPAKFNF